MKWPPMVLYMKIVHHHGRFGLWIPLFLLGPLFTLFLLAVLLIILPFMLVAVIVAGLAVLFEFQTEWVKETLRYTRWAGYAIKGTPLLVRVLCSLPGLKIDVTGRREQVYLTFH